MNLKNKKSIEKNQKGVTMIALIITIIVLLIIASISIGSALNSHETAAKNKLLTEVGMVQHAALERYTQESLMNSNILPGTPYSSMDEIKNDITELSSEEKLTNLLNNNQTPSDYYYLETADLEEMQITNTEDSYIINYKLGLAINVTTPKTALGKPVYVYAKDSAD